MQVNPAMKSGSAGTMPPDLSELLRNALRWGYPRVCSAFHFFVTSRFQPNVVHGRAPAEVVENIREYLATHPSMGTYLWGADGVPRTYELPKGVPDVLRSSFEEGSHFPGIQRELFVLKEASIRGGFCGALVTRDGRLILSASPCPWGWRAHPALRRLDFPKPRGLNGRVLYLCTPGLHGGNYYHCLLDCLPKLFLLGSGIHPASSWDHVVVNSDRPYLLDALQRIGIPSEKIIFLEERSNFIAEELHVPWFEGSLHGVDAWQTEAARSIYRTNKSPEGKSRLYLVRESAGRRRILNEASLLKLLESFGFQAVDCSALSIGEQAMLFQDAEAVVSVHGAALANIIFCQPGTRVVEIFNPLAVRTLYRSLATVLGLEYYAAASIPSARGLGMPLHRRMSLDFSVDEDSFSLVLRELFLSGSP